MLHQVGLPRSGPTRSAVLMTTPHPSPAPTPATAPATAILRSRRLRGRRRTQTQNRILRPGLAVGMPNSVRMSVDHRDRDLLSQGQVLGSAASALAINQRVCGGDESGPAVFIEVPPSSQRSFSRLSTTWYFGGIFDSDYELKLIVCRSSAWVLDFLLPPSEDLFHRSIAKEVAAKL